MAGLVWRVLALISCFVLIHAQPTSYDYQEDDSENHDDPDLTVYELTDLNFHQLTDSSDLPWLILFFDPESKVWNHIVPMFHEMIYDLHEHYNLAIVNAPRCHSLRKEFRLSEFPALVYYQNGVQSRYQGRLTYDLVVDFFLDKAHRELEEERQRFMIHQRRWERPSFVQHAPPTHIHQKLKKRSQAIDKLIEMADGTPGFRAPPENMNPHYETEMPMANRNFMPSHATEMENHQASRNMNHEYERERMEQMSHHPSGPSQQQQAQPQAQGRARSEPSGSNRVNHHAANQQPRQASNAKVELQPKAQDGSLSAAQDPQPPSQNQDQPFQNYVPNANSNQPNVVPHQRLQAPEGSQAAPVQAQQNDQASQPKGPMEPTRSARAEEKITRIQEAKTRARQSREFIKDAAAQVRSNTSNNRTQDAPTVITLHISNAAVVPLLLVLVILLIVAYAYRRELKIWWLRRRKASYLAGKDHEHGHDSGLFHPDRTVPVHLSTSSVKRSSHAPSTYEALSLEFHSTEGVAPLRSF